jgi:hypothetical protein
MTRTKHLILFDSQPLARAEAQSFEEARDPRTRRDE